MSIETYHLSIKTQVLCKVSLESSRDITFTVSRVQEWFLYDLIPLDDADVISLIMLCYSYFFMYLWPQQTLALTGRNHVLFLILHSLPGTQQVLNTQLLELYHSGTLGCIEEKLSNSALTASGEMKGCFSDRVLFPQLIKRY